MLLVVSIAALAGRPQPARAVNVALSGTLNGGTQTSLPFAASAGAIGIAISCSTTKAKVVASVIDTSGATVPGGTTVKCGKAGVQFSATASVDGDYQLILREKKGLTTVYSATIEGGTSPSPTTTTTSSSTTTTVPRQGDDVLQCSANGDETALLQAAIDGTPDGGNLRISGRCTISGQVWIFDRRNLTIEGTGDTVIDASATVARDVRHLRIQSGSGITLRNFSIIGGRTGCTEICGSGTLSRQHGLAIESRKGSPISDVAIDRMTISGVHGDFIYLGTKGTDAISDLPTNIRITNSEFTNSGRQGIAIAGGADIVIRDNRFESAGRTTFDFEAEAGGASRVDIIANDIRDFDNAVLNVGCASRGGPLLNRGPIVLTDNRTFGQDFVVRTSCEEVRANISVDASNQRVD